MSKKTKIDLHKNELDRINDVLSKFDSYDHIEIETETGISGIGSITILRFNYTINGVDGVFETEITGVEHW